MSAVPSRWQQLVKNYQGVSQIDPESWGLVAGILEGDPPDRSPHGREPEGYFYTDVLEDKISQLIGSGPQGSFSTNPRSKNAVKLERHEVHTPHHPSPLPPLPCLPPYEESWCRPQSACPPPPRPSLVHDTESSCGRVCRVCASPWPRQRASPPPPLWGSTVSSQASLKSSRVGRSGARRRRQTLTSRRLHAAR